MKIDVSHTFNRRAGLTKRELEPMLSMAVGDLVESRMDEYRTETDYRWTMTLLRRRRDILHRNGGARFRIIESEGKDRFWILRTS